MEEVVTIPAEMVDGELIYPTEVDDICSRMFFDLFLYPGKLLRKKCVNVDFRDDGCPAIVDVDTKMKNAIRKYNALGIAAPQVGYDMNLIALNNKCSGVEFFINPEIIQFSNKRIVTIEGCLSIPFLQGKVERAESVIVRYTDMCGDHQETAFGGIEAVVLQHEIDHLNGVLFIDRAEEGSLEWQVPASLLKST